MKGTKRIAAEVRALADWQIADLVCGLPDEEVARIARAVFPGASLAAIQYRLASRWAGQQRAAAAATTSKAAPPEAARWEIPDLDVADVRVPAPIGWEALEVPDLLSADEVPAPAPALAAPPSPAAAPVRPIPLCGAAVVANRIAEVLKHDRSFSAAEVAERIGEPVWRTQNSLARLRDEGRAFLCGTRRTARWARTADLAAGLSPSFSIAQVRELLKQDRAFTHAEVVSALGLDPMHARYVLRRLRECGEAVGDGMGTAALWARTQEILDAARGRTLQPAPVVAKGPEQEVPTAPPADLPAVAEPPAKKATVTPAGEQASPSCPGRASMAAEPHSRSPRGAPWPVGSQPQPLPRAPGGDHGSDEDEEPEELEDDEEPEAEEDDGAPSSQPALTSAAARRRANEIASERREQERLRSGHYELLAKLPIVAETDGPDPDDEDEPAVEVPFDAKAKPKRRSGRRRLTDLDAPIPPREHRFPPQVRGASRSRAVREERQRRILPMLLGPGPRREDCALYEQHLDAVAHEDIEAHCPRDCADFAPADTTETLLHLAGSRPRG